MPESRVPMMFSDQCKKDPLFPCNVSTKEKSVSGDRSVQRSDEYNIPVQYRLRPWVTPKINPRLVDDSLVEKTDSHLLGLKEDGNRMEISLNTVGYKPEQLKVNVSEDMVRLEGRHQERDESGKMTVRRQFSREYRLPQGADRDNIVSDLSQDGIMIINIPKKESMEISDNNNIKVEHVQNVKDISKVMEEKSKLRKKSRGVEGLSEMLRRRSSLLEVVNSGDSILVKKEGEGLQEEQENKIKDQVKSRRSSLAQRQMENRLVPMTVRSSFLEDPFFKNTLINFENTREDFFKKARQNFENSIKSMKSWRPERLDVKIHSMNKNKNVIQQIEDEVKLEVRLDTSGYKLEELKVTVCQGVITVSGKHEEVDKEGEMRVSKQFYRSYQLPQGCREEEVVSSRSKDNILMVTAPKQRGTEAHWL